MSHKPVIQFMAKLGKPSLMWKRYLQARFQPYGINLKQVHLLNALKDGSHLYPSEIAEMFFCDRPTATSMINTLEKHGWVKRLNDPENKKRVKVEITAKGRKKVSDIPKSVWPSNSDGLDPRSCFSKKELATLESLLDRLDSHMTERLDP